MQPVVFTHHRLFYEVEVVENVCHGEDTDRLVIAWVVRVWACPGIAGIGLS
jgi:hypothetical protein